MRRTTKKRILWVTVLTAVLGGGAWAVAGRPSGPDRALVVRPEVSDLGTVKRLGGVVTTTFDVWNPGVRDLTVKSITTS